MEGLPTKQQATLLTGAAGRANPVSCKCSLGICIMEGKGKGKGARARAAGPCWALLGLAAACSLLLAAVACLFGLGKLGCGGKAQVGLPASSSSSSSQLPSLGPPPCTELLGT